MLVHLAVYQVNVLPSARGAIKTPAIRLRDGATEMHRCCEGSFKCPYKKKQEATVPFSPMETQQVVGSHRQTTDVLAFRSGSFQLLRVWATAETQTVIFCYNHRQSKTHLPVTTESRRGKKSLQWDQAERNASWKVSSGHPRVLDEMARRVIWIKKKKQTDVWL